MMVIVRLKAAAAGLMLAGVVLGAGGAMAQEDPSGVWGTEKHESQIKIYRCENDAICGTVAWIKEPVDAKGNPKLDRENEDEAKRKRPILGLQLIHMTPDEDHWKGTVYNPQNGKTYSATLKMLGHNQVELEGCVAYVLCGSQKWAREELKPLPTPATAAHAPPAKPPAAAAAH